MQSIAEKIKKILEKAASTEHEGEASVLIETAQRLMEKHQLELWEVEGAGDPIGSTFTEFYQSGASSYKPQVRRALARLYGCTVVILNDVKVDPKLKRGFTAGFKDDIIGPESARITTDLMTDYVWAQINREAARLEKQGHGKRSALGRQIANALCQRIWIMVRDQETEAPKARTETANALVVQMRNAVEDYRDERYPNLRTSKGRARGVSEAARNAAAGISLSRQTTGTKQAAIGR